MHPPFSPYVVKAALELFAIAAIGFGLGQLISLIISGGGDSP
jgi:hypothetical protein